MNENVTPSQPQKPSPPVSLELFHGLWKAIVARTLVELEIPDHLISGQKTVTELAKVTGTKPELLYRFLRAAASCQFINEINTSEALPQRIFSASEQTQSMCSGQPLYFLIRYLLAKFSIDAWNQLGENLRTGERAMDAVLGMPLWEYLNTHPQENRDFNGSMTSLSEGVNFPLVKAYPDFSHMEMVVDIGGGQGSFLRTILQANPSVKGILFDREQVMEQAKAQFKNAGLSERCTCVSGSFLDEIPVTADAYTFKNVFHDWDDDQVLRILRNVRRSAQSGARVLIAELLIAEENPSFAVCGLDLQMLFETGGKQRTVREFEQLFEQSGFVLERVLPVGRTPYNIVEGLAK